MPSMGIKTETSRWREGKLNREFSHPNETHDHSKWPTESLGERNKVVASVQKLGTIIGGKVL